MKNETTNNGRVSDKMNSLVGGFLYWIRYSYTPVSIAFGLAITAGFGIGGLIVYLVSLIH